MIRSTLALLKSGRGQTLLAGAAYLALALFVTWPWLLHPSRTIYGVIGGDQTASIAMFQQYADAHQIPFLPGTLHSLNAPEGLDVQWTVNLAAFSGTLTLWLLSMVVGAVAAHGLLAVVGYSLSAFTLFVVVRRVTHHPGAAFVAGLAFGFWPYTYGTGWTWPNYIQGWVFVLLAWRMLVSIERPSLRNGLLAGLAAVWAMTFIQYNLLIGGVAFGCMVVGALVVAWRQRTLAAQIRTQATACTVVVIVVGALVALAASISFSGAPVRPASDAYLNSARPLMYLLPGPQHILFGHSVGDWLVRKYPSPLTDPSTTAIYEDIYLGVPLMLLALAGVVVLAWRRAASLAGFGLFAAALALVGLLFSAPPKVAIAGSEVPMPYTLVNQVSTAFRAAARFSELVMLGAACLAAVALAILLSPLSVRTRALVLVLVASLIAVDGWARPTPATSRLSHPAIYDLLAQQPAGTVAEYPLSDAPISQNAESLAQHVHRHPLFNGWDDGSPSGTGKLALASLTRPETTRVLAAYGVRYVLVHEAAPGSKSDVPPAGAKIPGLRLLAQAQGGALYRVVAAPPRFFVATDGGFVPPEGPAPGAQWMFENGAQLDLHGRCAPCVGTIRFGTGTFVRPRQLAVTDASGRTLFRRLIASSGETVSIPVRFTTKTTLRFTTVPAPDRIDDFLHNGDTRSFGVFVGLPVTFHPNDADGHHWDR